MNQTLNQTLIDFILNAPPPALPALKLTLLLAAAWTLHFALVRANPRWRVLLWRGAALGLLALPLVMAASPRLDLPLLPAAPAGPQPLPPLTWPDFAPPAPLDPVALPPMPESPVLASPALPPAPPVPVRWGLWLAAAWGAGALLLGLRFLHAQRAMRRLVRQAAPAPEVLQRIFDSVADGLGLSGVSLRLSSAVSTPLLFGLRAPVVLLPNRMGGDSFRDDLPAIFAHELSHVRSRDLAWMALVRLVQLLAWPHPLAWRMHSACGAAGERVCDAAAAGALRDRDAYSRSLARVALALAGRPVGSAALAMALPDVRRRLLALQRGRAARPLSRLAVRLALIFSLLMLAALGALKPVQAQNKIDVETIIDTPQPANATAAAPTPTPDPTSLGKLDIENFSLNHPGYPEFTTETLEFNARVVQSIETLLYSKSGKLAAAAQGRRLWYDPLSNQLTIVDTPENLADVHQLLDSLPKLDPAMHHQTIFLKNARKGTSDTQNLLDGIRKRIASSGIRLQGKAILERFGKLDVLLVSYQNPEDWKTISAAVLAADQPRPDTAPTPSMLVRIYKIDPKQGPRIKALINSILTASNTAPPPGQDRKLILEKDDLIVRDTPENIKKIEELLSDKNFIQDMLRQTTTLPRPSVQADKLLNTPISISTPQRISLDEFLKNISAATPGVMHYTVKSGAKAQVYANFKDKPLREVLDTILLPINLAWSIDA